MEVAPKAVSTAGSTAAVASGGCTSPQGKMFLCVCVCLESMDCFDPLLKSYT